MLAQNRIILLELQAIRIVTPVLESMINVCTLGTAHLYMRANIFFLLGHKNLTILSDIYKYCRPVTVITSIRRNRSPDCII